MTITYTLTLEAPGEAPLLQTGTVTTPALEARRLLQDLLTPRTSPGALAGVPGERAWSRVVLEFVKSEPEPES